VKQPTDKAPKLAIIRKDGEVGPNYLLAIRR